MPMHPAAELGLKCFLAGPSPPSTTTRPMSCCGSLMLSTPQASQMALDHVLQTLQTSRRCSSLHGLVDRFLRFFRQCARMQVRQQLYIKQAGEGLSRMLSCTWKTRGSADTSILAANFFATLTRMVQTEGPLSIFKGLSVSLFHKQVASADAYPERPPCVGRCHSQQIKVALSPPKLIWRPAVPPSAWACTISSRPRYTKRLRKRIRTV